jgi:hypothetical protein
MKILLDFNAKVVRETVLGMRIYMQLVMIMESE